MVRTLLIALLALSLLASLQATAMAAESKPKAESKQKQKPPKKKKKKKPPAAQAAPLPQKTIDARIKLLGAQNVNPKTGVVRSDKIIFSWYGISNFVASFRGQVVILDSFLRRGYDLGQLDTSLEELAAVKPAYIFIGHSHYDHAIDAGELAVLSGAPLVGTKTHCEQIKHWSGMLGVDVTKIGCVEAMPDDAPVASSVRRTDLLKKVPVTVLRHQHFPYSPAEPTGLGQTNLTEEEGPEYPCPQEPQWEGFAKFPSDTQDLRNIIVNGVGLGSALIPNEGGQSLLYQFKVGNLNITWHDTQGTLDYYPEVREAMLALPRSDIELGSIASLQRATNCLHDVRMYWEALRTKVFVPTHHDVSDPTEANAAFYKPFLADGAGRIPEDQRPCIHMIEDPQHYLNPDALTWDEKSPATCSPAMTLHPEPPQPTPSPNYLESP
jgi:L-ascorbate metabolism protein UlaG (beta-lactamase superfamily)